MKITVINGSMRKGSTYHFAHMVIDQLAKSTGVNVQEFFLPRDLPQFCTSCFGCIYKGEMKCPHFSHTSILKQAMLEADLLIVTSPVYVLDISGQLKAFFDHFGYQWMTHRPEPLMFSKIGLGVVTAAGAGMKTSLKTIEKNLNWWGFSRTFNLGQAVMASAYADISAKGKEKMERKATQTAKSIYSCLQKKNRKPRFITKFLFGLMKMGRTGHPEWNPIDTDFWKNQGYLDGTKPWKQNSMI